MVVAPVFANEQELGSVSKVGSIGTSNAVRKTKSQDKVAFWRLLDLSVTFSEMSSDFLEAIPTGRSSHSYVHKPMRFHEV